MRFQRDGSWQRFGRVIIGGSPLKVFRTTEAAGDVLDAVERGDEIPTAVHRSRLIDRLVDAGAIHPVPADIEHAHTLSDVTIVTPMFGGTVDPDDRIIVDDGSEPPLAGATVRLDQNAGPAAARNAGRRRVTTPLIAFIDDDVDVLDDLGGGCWLTPLLGHFDDPRVGLVAPQVAGEAGSTIDLGSVAARIRAGTRVSYVPAAAIVMRTEAFDDVGGFDEGLRYGEDVDLVWRLDEAGWCCRYEPVSVVWHEPRSTWSGRLRQNAAYGTSAAPLEMRHPGALSPLRTNGWTASAWGIGLLGHPLVAAGIAIGSAAALVPRLPDVPARWSFKLAMEGNLRAVQQYATAVRRVWWPVALVAGLVSRRARLVALAAVALDVRATPNDIAYGWGVWKGMIRHRTLRPIIPRLAPWPGRQQLPSRP